MGAPLEASGVTSLGADFLSAVGVSVRGGPESLVRSEPPLACQLGPRGGCWRAVTPFSVSSLIDPASGHILLHAV